MVQARPASCLCLLLLHALLGSASPLSIGIIGGGLGGAATAHWIRDLLGDDVNITLFERDQELGGRCGAVSLGNSTVDLGAHRAWHGSLYIKALAQSAGLDLTPTDHLPSIFDGQSLIWAASPWWIVNTLQSLWRWGLNPWLLKIETTKLWARLSHVYHLQNSGQAYTEPQQLLRAVALYDSTQITLLESLKEVLWDGGWGTDSFYDEVVGATTRNAYDQTALQLNALAGTISLLEVADPGSFGVSGGLAGLVAALARSAGVHVLLSSSVQSISREEPSGPLSLSIMRGEVGPPTTAEFDVVVLAAPLEGSGVDLRGVKGLAPHFPRKYGPGTVTLVRGRVRASYFGQPATKQLQHWAVVATGAAPVPFSTLQRLVTAPGEGSLWRLSGRDSLPHAWLSIIFEAGWAVEANSTWAAFPLNDPPEDFTPFQLAEGLLYNNALENAGSTLELAAIAARNSALLLGDSLRHRDRARTTAVS